MPQSTVVSYSQMVQQLSQESSEKAHDSQVTVILSLMVNQVIASLIAQQMHLLRTSTSMKGGDHYPKLVPRYYWDNTMVMLMEFIIAIHSEPNWKIDVWKTGGLLYSSPASTSSDMTQPANNIISITTRRMSTTVIRNNDVVNYAADMQTQSTSRESKAKLSPISTILL